MSIKLRFRPRAVVVLSKRWESIKPPDSYPTMCLQQYPPAPHSALDRENQRMIWMRAEKFLGAE